MSITWPDGIIDPHIHQWDPFTTERTPSKEARLLRALPRIPRAIRWAVPRADREFVGHPHHILKPYLPGNHRIDSGAVPVRTVVHVEAEWPHPQHRDTVEETRWVSALPFGQGDNPVLGAIVAHVDPRWSDVGEILDAHLEASQLVRGVRFSLATHPDPGVRPFCDDPAVVSDPAFLDGFGAIAARGLSFELWCYAHQLRAATSLVQRFPETMFVLDHYATPVGVFGPRGKHTGRTAQERAAILATWQEDVAAIAEHGNVVAKHSGLGMPVLGGDPARPVDVADLGPVTERSAPLVRQLHDCFGPDRTMWASNYPMDKPSVTIPASVQLLIDVLGSDADLPKLLRDVAARTYGIDTTRAE